MPNRALNHHRTVNPLQGRRGNSLTLLLIGIARQCRLQCEVGDALNGPLLAESRPPARSRRSDKLSE
jgi:hypothetical protein